MQEAHIVEVGLNGLNSDWLWEWSRAMGRSQMPQPPVLTDVGEVWTGNSETDELEADHGRFMIGSGHTQLELLAANMILKDQEDRMKQYIITFITMVIACGRLAKSKSHTTTTLHTTTARQAHKLENMARGSQQQMVKLLECGIGIWPMQLPQYAEVVMLADEYEDTLVRMKETDDPHPATYGNWQELVHPLGERAYIDEPQTLS
ncbi:hypothetical protein DFH29DRAFT_877669 [Suillus ampliporus]|nr:hypothetical protein DFH29DRAFT_877669 [Suillus ampliporus]